MSFDFTAFKETENIVPIKLEAKEQFYLDLMNIEHSWTGRIDAMFANQFFREAVQLIVNSLKLFEKGYFDCAFYSLRQSLEISTTIVYFIDDSETNRNEEMRKWKNQERFPMHNQMLNELQKRKNVFAEIREKMNLYFDEIEVTKQKLNKYVHKQGLDKFYVARNNSLHKEKKQAKLITDFTEFLTKSMGAIAVFRLAIDPFPLLLADESIYARTGLLMTEGFSDQFIEKYIGLENIAAYKETKLYMSHYESIIQHEEMIPSVLDVVKHNYIDKSKIDEIISQKHLLSLHDTVSVAIVSFSDKVAKVYCIGGWHWYFTNTHTIKTSQSWGSFDFDVFNNDNEKFNVPYDEAFLSHLKIWDEDFYIEHNSKFSELEIKVLNEISTTHSINIANSGV
jgi:hypothetical protein